MKISTGICWGRILAAALVLAVLFGAGGFSLQYTHGDMLHTLTDYPTLENWQDPTFLQKEMESNIRSHIPYRMQLRDVYSASLVAQGKRGTDTFYIIKNDSGYLFQINLYQAIDPNVEEYAKRLRRASVAASASGAQLLFVGAAGKYMAGFIDLPAGYYPDRGSIRNLDELLLDLLTYQVNDLDMREAFKASSFAYEDIYYRTDSQRTARADLFVAGNIARTARDKLGLAIDPDGFYGDLANYDTTAYLGILLGDYGRSVGIPWSGMDDFIVVTPRFETDLTLEIPSDDIVRRGPFTESILDSTYLYVQNPWYTYSMSAYYGAEDTPFRIVNHLAPQGEKILFLCDNNFLTSAAYLALMCSELEAYVITQHDADEIETLVTSGDYSLVVIACDAQSIGANMFPFFAE